MLKKCIVMGVVCLTMISSFGITAFASDVVTSSDSTSMVFCTGPLMPDEFYKSTSNLPRTVRYENSMISNRAATIRVNIQTPLETSWRNTYSDYYYQANAIVETIDDKLYDRFDIDFYTISQPSWDVGSVALPSVAMNILINTQGKGNADIMLAFAGPIFDTASSAGYGMTSAIGEPYCIVFDHGFDQNCKSALHEVGHAYGLDHCESTCVMKQGADTNKQLFNAICNDHKTKWEKAKNKY